MSMTSDKILHGLRAANAMARILVCVSLFATVGCRYVADDGTRTKPAAGVLVGTWVPDKESLKHMREVGGYDTSNKTVLQLEADGTYKMNNVPDWLWLDDGLSRKTLRSERGTWEVAHFADTPFWIVWLRTEVTARSAALLGQQPPYRLEFSFGNIDTNPQSITFVKEG